MEPAQSWRSDRRVRSLLEHNMDEGESIRFVIEGMDGQCIVALDERLLVIKPGSAIDEPYSGLSQPWADVVLSGAATVEALHSNLSALRAPAYDQETDRRLLPLREEREHYWSERANLLWT